MAASPIIPLIIVVCTLGFEALMFGNDLVASSFPELLPVDFGECTATQVNFLGLDFSNPISLIGCWIGNVVHAIGDVFLILFGVVILLGQVFSFNVPGAPVIARVIVGVILIGSVSWSVATLFRGN